MDFKIETFASVSSTQDKAIELLNTGASEGLVVQAMSMENGRGRQGNAWHAPMGNLYLSIVLRPDISEADCGQMSFVAALAVVETARSLTDEDLKINVKWPNDVLVEGKKLAGILIDKQGSAYILGVGINILAAPEYATALQAHSDKRLPINPVRDFFLDVFDAYYTKWLNEGFENIQEQWMRKAAFLNEKIGVRLSSREEQGIFKGIDQDGALLLETTDGTRRFVSGEVFI